VIEKKQKRHFLPKESVIKDSSEFRTIFDQGVGFRSRYFLAFVKEANYRKVGFTIKRGLGAVKRNRLKRILRELWRCSDNTGDLRGHVVLTIKEEAGKVEHHLIKDDFEKLLGRIRVHFDRQSKES